MKSFLVVLVLLLVLPLTATGDIAVLRVESPQQIALPSGSRCRFSGEFPREPIRVRIFKGQRSFLARKGGERSYVRQGCVIFPSLIIDATRFRKIADLGLYFDSKWLNGRRDGDYTFVFERIPAGETPRPRVVRSEEIHLAANQTALYFESGIDVTVVAPRYLAATSGGSQPASRNGHGRPPASANGHGPETSMAGDEAPEPAPVEIDEASERIPDCVVVQQLPTPLHLIVNQRAQSEEEMAAR